MEALGIVLNRNSRDMTNDEEGTLCRDARTNIKIESLIYTWKRVTLGLVLGTNTDLHVDTGHTLARRLARCGPLHTARAGQA